MRLELSASIGEGRTNELEMRRFARPEETHLAVTLAGGVRPGAGAIARAGWTGAGAVCWVLAYSLKIAA